MSNNTPVSLISITPDAEQLIAYCARVSNPPNQTNPNAAGLIRYCIKNHHWSILEMAHMVLEVNTTRAIAAQLLRHRSFSFQEFSQRYADVSLMDFASVPELRRQDTKNRQNSINDLDVNMVARYNQRIEALYADSEELYKSLLLAGVAKESAREVLPLGTPSRLYVSGTIRSWLHYIDLRQANGTQKEHRDIAVACRGVLEKECPTICAAMWE